MGKADRRCPYCGGQTSHTACEICGRKTVYSPHADHMDVQRNTPLPFEQESSSDKEAYASDQVDHSHIQQMMKHPRPFIDKSKQHKALFLYGGILLFVLALVGFLVGQEKRIIDVDSDSSLQDAYDYYERFLTVQEKDVSKLTCSVDEADAEIAVVHNPYQELFTADVKLMLKNGKSEMHSIWRGIFQGDEFVFADKEIASCSLEHVELEAYGYELPSFDYRMKETRIDVNQELTSKQIQQLSKHIYTKLIVAFYDISGVYDLYINEEKSYEITFDYYENRISFQALGGHEEIDDIDMSW